MREAKPQSKDPYSYDTAVPHFSRFLRQVGMLGINKDPRLGVIPKSRAFIRGLPLAHPLSQTAPSCDSPGRAPRDPLLK